MSPRAWGSTPRGCGSRTVTQDPAVRSPWTGDRRSGRIASEHIVPSILPAQSSTVNPLSSTAFAGFIPRGTRAAHALPSRGASGVVVCWWKRRVKAIHQERVAQPRKRSVEMAGYARARARAWRPATSQSPSVRSRACLALVQNPAHLWYTPRWAARLVTRTDHQPFLRSRRRG